MASKKAVLAGGKSAELVAALAEGYDLEPAPSKAFGKLRPRGTKRTLCWVIPGAKAVRLHIHADLASAPKALTKDTWPGAAGAPQLKVTGENVKQARELLAWIAKQAPAKAPVKAAAAKAKPAAKKSTAAKRARPKASAVVAKRRIHFRTATGDVRTEDVPESEAASFVESVKAQGAEVITDKPKAAGRGSKTAALVEAGIASDAKESSEQLADMGGA